jgi:lipopolysaccharide transport system permease protein
MQILSLRNISVYNDLLFAWTTRIIRARYQQSVLGVLWAIIQPAAAVVIFSIIFTFFIPVDTAGIPYLIFSYTAMVPWTLFSGSITDMVESLITNMNLVSKIYFPREVLPVAALLARLLDFAIASVVLVLLMVYYQMPLFLPGLFLLPIIIMIQLAISLGVGLIGSATNVFFRDIKHLISLGLQVWFYATPIIYPISVVPETIRPFYYLNPMAGIIDSYRSILLYQSMPGSYLFISAAVALIVLATGYIYFKRLEHQFADVI